MESPIKGLNLNPAREYNESYAEYKERRLKNKQVLYGFTENVVNPQTGLFEKIRIPGYLNVGPILFKKIFGDM